ncbi:protein kinase domain-containing protein [Archangium sp.]|uniref:serine/threonine-protein kinase n=1 Tax=Archangium sp. TaxID=1872627 RepID=UPI00286AA441|nr:protein kinase [Archangium sp.]
MAGSKTPQSPDDVRGRQMGNYEVLCRLSTGGMAEIFLATKRGLAGFHKPVVLKKILPDIQGQEEFVQMFLDEAKVTAAFNHPNIAQVFDLDVDKDELFLTMEFVPGATLVEVARACRALNEPMPMGFGLAAVRDTALALHYAHTFTDALGEPSPVIHRDVAEKNIMVTYEGVTKLLDFGIAKNLGGESRTQVGMVKGTSGYMSPEQIRGEPLDARSDLFSLGVVLYECITGMRLFPGKSPMAVAQAVLRAPIAEPSRANKAIPPELDAIVLKALARQRDDRYASTLEFARELERAVNPLIWLPEKSGELLRRLFAERREQTRQLLARGRAAVDSTGEVKLAQLFGDKETPATPPPAPGVAAPRTPPAGQAMPPRASMGRIPTISAPNFPTPSPRANSEMTEVVAPPPPPEEPEPNGQVPSAARARPPRPPPEPPTQLAAPPVAEPPRAAPRMPPAEPPTQLAAPRSPLAELPTPRRSLSRSDALPPPPAPQEEQTAILRPPRPAPEPPSAPSQGAQPVRPGILARRPTLDTPLQHLDAVTQPTGSTLPLATQGGGSPDVPTVPHMRSPLARPRPPEPEDDDELTRPMRVRTPARPLPLDPEENTGPELLTAPMRAPAWSPGSAEPDELDEATVSSLQAPEPARSGQGLKVVLLLVLLLVGAGVAAVALRLDGGLLSSWLFPAAPEGPQAPTPIADPTKPQEPPAPPPPPASTEAATPAPEAQPVDTGSTPPAAAPEAAAVEPSSPPPSTPGAVPEAAAASGSTTATEATSAPPPEAESLPVRLDTPPEPAPPTKRAKSVPSTRRKRGESAPAEALDAETSPEVVANSSEANRAWESLERERSGTADTAGASDTGTLTLATDEGAKVYLGNRLLGEAPLFRVTLPVGKHTLRVVGTEGKAMRFQVEIKSGELTSIRKYLEKSARE